MYCYFLLMCKTWIIKVSCLNFHYVPILYIPVLPDWYLIIANHPLHRPSCSMRLQSVITDMQYFLNPCGNRMCVVCSILSPQRWLMRRIQLLPSSFFTILPLCSTAPFRWVDKLAPQSAPPILRDVVSAVLAPYDFWLCGWQLFQHLKHRVALLQLFPFKNSATRQCGFRRLQRYQPIGHPHAPPFALPSFLHIVSCVLSVDWPSKNYELFHVWPFHAHA